jgi:hypothetical protein
MRRPTLQVVLLLLYKIFKKLFIVPMGFFLKLLLFVSPHL